MLWPPLVKSNPLGPFAYVQCLIDFSSFHFKVADAARCGCRQAAAFTECSAESAIILHFSQNSIEFGLEERTLTHHTDTHSTASTLKHSHTHTEKHTLGQGGNVNKMDRVKYACGALRCAAACATFAALHYTGFSAPRHIRFNFLSPCPAPLANHPLLLPHVAALSAARQCCCAKHNLALHTFERLFLEKLNYEHTTNVKKHGKTKQPSCVCSTASIPCNEQQLLSHRMIAFCK